MSDEPPNNDQTGLSEPLPINTMGSEPTEVPSRALESLPNDFSVKSNNIPPSDSTSTEAINEPKTQEKQAVNESSTEPIPASTQGSGEAKSEPVQTIEPSTAQIPGNEPLAPEPEIKTEPNIQEVKPEPVSVSNSGVASEAKAEPENINPIPVIIPSKNKVLELLNKAKLAIQFRKRKKLNRVMTLFLKKSKITNDEVEKFLHVSDATATRYLSQLEKENKIKQSVKNRKSVFYIKI